MVPASDADSSKNSNRALNEQSSQSENRAPWKAGYHTSLKSQKLIQDAATDPIHKLPIERATAVLTTFLSIPHYKCNAANLVCALTLSAKVMGRESSDNFRSLLYRTNNVLCQMLERKSLSARQLCNAAWALAKHYDRDASVLPAAPEPAALTSDTITSGTAENWDLRNDVAGCPAQRLDKTIDEIATQLTSILNDNHLSAKEGELCMASWAYGILRRRRRPPGWQQDPQLSPLPLETSGHRQEIASHFIKFEQWGSSSESANVNLDVDSATGTLLDAIGHALCKYIESVPESGVEAHQRLRRCTWSELANVAWAFACHGRSCSQDSQILLATIASEASRRLSEQGSEAKQALSRDISQIIWSLGTLQADNYRLGDSLIQVVDALAVFIRDSRSSEFRKWSCTDIVQVALSLAHARLDERAMIDGLYTEAVGRLHESGGSTRNHQSTKLFQMWEASVLLWALARLYLNGSQGQIFDTFARKAVSIITAELKRGSSFANIGIGQQEQANLAWSLTVLELCDKNPDSVRLLESIFAEAATSFQREGVIQVEHAHQLWQALFLLEEECPSCVTAVPAWFRKNLQSKWCTEKARPKISSARHMSLSKTLSLMGVAHVNEHEEDIDVAIVLKTDAAWTHETEMIRARAGVRVAVEFDGPNHFTRQQNVSFGSKPEPPRALGHTVLKYRLLKKQGWTVVRVPYYEYDKIPFWASMERQRYLQRLLKTHGNLQFSDIDVSEYKIQVPNRGSRFD